MEEKNINKKSEAALREEQVLQFWKENKIFEKSLEKKSPKGKYVFYDGPPFATGTPHYGHILGSTVKDVIGRYQTMCGYSVPRRWGWDCHGLPIENIVEKDLNISGKKAIEELGIDKFVTHARSKVLTYVAEWEKTINRMGRWVDFGNSYKTMDNTFIESVWWALGELQKKDLLYEGVRVLAYCPRCETPIANSEIAMDNSYKDISDISVYVKFELEKEPGTYFLAWTTTPWTLPGNTAIALNKNFVYVKIKAGDDILILAKETLENALRGRQYSVLGEIKGENLLGMKYRPIFPYYEGKEVAKNTKIWKAWHADFVTADTGTGIAHQAPAFGEDDMNLAKQNGIPWIIHVDETGKFKPEIYDFAGMAVKPKSEEKDGHQKTDIEVLKYLAKNNTLFEKEKIIHSYPHCYRCETPLLYYSLPSWFVNIQKIKNNLLKNAEFMNWIPAHLKNGRFKNTMESAPDWTISRNRYWASPLPFWKSKTGKIIFVNSLEDLKKKAKKTGNKYIVIRHGESENNTKLVVDSGERELHLTKAGQEKIISIIESLKNEKIDVIISSDILRAKETAELIAPALGREIKFDSKLRELHFGIFAGKPDKEWRDFSKDYFAIWDKKYADVETLREMRNRLWSFIEECEKTYEGKNILLVTHEYGAWFLKAVLEGWDKEKIIQEKIVRGEDFIGRGEVFSGYFNNVPRNSEGEIDLHRPYIDSMILVDETGEEYKRIPEVIDCWFESGSMPFAQDHYPFENLEWKKKNFPSGFVAEYIAQTRTWFYYTHVISSVLFNHAPFENVVTTGTVLAEDGQKMSKSKNNFPDPALLFDKYGVDSLRFYLMSGPLMKGEDVNFSEKAVQEISNKIIGRLYNVFSFYELYRDKNLEKNSRLKTKNVLDKWILRRLDEVVEEVSSGMKKYDMTLATRPFEMFIDDLSTWYLRRSRERIKEGDKETKKVLYFVLMTLVKIMAPFTPFISEFIWLNLKNEKNEESVHLTFWPKVWTRLNPVQFLGKNIIKNMQKVREIVTLGLEARQKAGIKVRQPLAWLEVKDLDLENQFIELIKDEINVKEVKENTDLADIVSLNVEITEGLKTEGEYRELVRALQEIRKNKGLTPNDVILLTLETGDLGKKLIEKFEDKIKKTVLISQIIFEKNNGEEIKIGNLTFEVEISKE